MSFDPDLTPLDQPGALGLVYALAWTARRRRGQQVYEAPVPVAEVSGVSVSRVGAGVQVVVAGRAEGGAPAVWIGSVATTGAVGSLRAELAGGVMQLRLGAAAVPPPLAAGDCAGE